MSEIFFAKYYKFYRYEKELTEEDAKFTIPEGYIIRELNPDMDYEKFKSAWQKIYSAILPEPYVKIDKKILLKYPKTFIVINSKKDIVGFTVCYTKEDKKAGKILRIGVLLSLRKKGFGLLLYRQACKYYLSNNLKNIFFDVYESDFSLIKLAEKAGFKRTKEFYITIDDPIENFISLEIIMSL